MTKMTNGMRKLIQCRTAACVAMLYIATAVNAQSTNWKSYSYPADGFQASFASMPEVSKKDVPTEKGSFELRTYVAQDASVTMSVGVCDYGSSTTGKDPGELLQGAKNGMLQNTNSHLISEKKIVLGKDPGVQFEAKSDSAHFTSRVYLVGSTLYQTLVAAPLDKPYLYSIQFLDTFQLIARTKAD
jgi:hypothetical protein